jgi:hypothetical protein
LFLYFIAIPKKQNEKSEIGFCSETSFSSQDTSKIKNLAFSFL